MSGISEALSLVSEFAEMAMARRRGELPLEDRQRMDQIEDYLRDLIDGAHPAPRRIEGRPADDETMLEAADSAISTGDLVPQAALDEEPERPAARSSANGSSKRAAAGHSISNIADELELPDKEKAKIREIAAEKVPESGYTPPEDPCFLEDYYSSDLSIGGVLGSFDPTAKPRAIVAAGPSDEPVQLSEEVKTLFGVGQQQIQPAAAARAVSAPPAARPRPPPSPSQIAAQKTQAPAGQAIARVAVQKVPADPGRAPVIVHLLAGGFKRGDTGPFDPNSGQLALRAANATQEEIVSLEEVMAIFFSIPKGGTLRPAEGQRLVVQLANGKEVAGVSPDYAAGGTALTLIPEERRGTVDRIWIPAWGVQGIEFAE